MLSWMALVGFRGGGNSCHSCLHEGAEQGLAAVACVVQKLEEAKLEPQFVLRDAPV
jgi:hypothetical protein